MGMRATGSYPDHPSFSSKWPVLAATNKHPFIPLCSRHKDAFELCSKSFFFLKCTHWAELCSGLQHCDPIEQVQEGYVGITESALLTAIVIN